MGDHVAKINTLGAMDQNDDLLAKMPKIVVFWPSPSGILENQNFFRQNFSLGIYHLKMIRGGFGRNIFY